MSTHTHNGKIFIILIYRFNAYCFGILDLTLTVTVTVTMANQML